MRENLNSAEWIYAGFWTRGVAVIIDTVFLLIITYPLTRAIYGDVEALLESEIEADVARLTPAFEKLALEGASTLEIWGAVFSNMSWIPPVLGPADVVINWIFPVAAVVLFWIYKSATPGKMIMRTKIVDAKTGGAPQAFKFIVRYVGYFISFLPLGLGFLWAAFDKQKRGWHDLMAGTIVVRVPKIAGGGARVI